MCQLALANPPMVRHREADRDDWVDDNMHRALPPRIFSTPLARVRTTSALCAESTETSRRVPLRDDRFGAGLHFTVSRPHPQVHGTSCKTQGGEVDSRAAKPLFARVVTLHAAMRCQFTGRQRSNGSIRNPA